MPITLIIPDPFGDHFVQQIVSAVENDNFNEIERFETFMLDEDGYIITVIIGVFESQLLPMNPLVLIDNFIDYNELVNNNEEGNSNPLVVESQS